MKYHEAIEICENISQHKTEEILSAVEKILSMATVNAVSKDVLMNIIRWFWEFFVDADDWE